MLNIQEKSQQKEHVEAKALLAAASLAKSAHKGKTYGERDYYSYHILGVFTKVSKDIRSVLSYLNISLTDAAIVALLHDVKEDTLVSDKEILSAIGCLGKRRTSQIIKSINILTKAPGEQYFDYIKSIIRSRDPVAILVKLMDAKFNSQNTGKRSEKYRKVIEMLVDPVETLHNVKV